MENLIPASSRNNVPDGLRIKGDSERKGSYNFVRLTFENSEKLISHASDLPRADCCTLHFGVCTYRGERRSCAAVALRGDNFFVARVDFASAARTLNPNGVTAWPGVMRGALI